MSTTTATADYHQHDQSRCGHRQPATDPTTISAATVATGTTTRPTTTTATNTGGYQHGHQGAHHYKQASPHPRHDQQNDHHGRHRPPSPSASPLFPLPGRPCRCSCRATAPFSFLLLLLLLPPGVRLEFRRGPPLKAGASHWTFGRLASPLRSLPARSSLARVVPAFSSFSSVGGGGGGGGGGGANASVPVPGRRMQLGQAEAVSKDLVGLFMLLHDCSLFGLEKRLARSR